MREKRVALLRLINVAFLEYKQFTADNLAQMVRVALEVTFFFYDLFKQNQTKKVSEDEMEHGETVDTLVDGCNALLESFHHKIEKTRDEQTATKTWVYALVCTSSKVGEYVSRHSRDGTLEETNQKTSLREFRAKVVESMAISGGVLTFDEMLEIGREVKLAKMAVGEFIDDMSCNGIIMKTQDRYSQWFCI